MVYVLKMKKYNSIYIKGARVHNLKNIEIEIPHNQLVVITGLSGSGKSTLAFDTIFAEGYGRYDLYGGDLATLRESLISLKKYPRNLRLYAGHGAESTLGSAIENLYL